jgi:hypothetical protein
MKALLLNFALLFSPIVFSQTITLSGEQNPEPGAEEYYEASFDYSLHPQSILTWTVQGGTITYQITNPTAQTIYCIVEWDYDHSPGHLSLYDDLNNGFGEIQIAIGQYVKLQLLMEYPYTRSSINCSAISSSACNLITNNNFTPTTPYNWLDPFTTNAISGWTSSHGSPQITDVLDPTLQPPAPATGFAYMFVSGTSGGYGEGIAQKIPPLQQNNNYFLSFFMRVSLWLSPPYNSSQLDNLYIVLLNCNDFNNFPSPSYQIPSFPSNYQIIYHGTSLTNQSWEHIQISFTANESYDMIWIFPDQTNADFSGVDFAYPILSEGSPTPIITPSGPISECVHYETGHWYTLYTNLTSNIQWYENGNAISGATSPYLELWNNPNGGAGYPNCSSTITVKNTQTNCISNAVSVTRKNYSSPAAYVGGGGTYNTPSTYCASGGTIQQLPSINSGTIYWWEVYDEYWNPTSDISISPMYTTNHSATISFGSYPYTTAYIVPRASDNGCDMYMYNVNYEITINPGCRMANPNNGTINNNLVKSHLIDSEKKEVKRQSIKGYEISEQIKLFPNPASKQLTVTSKNLIRFIQITGMSGTIFKNIRASGQTVTNINIEDLPIGIYNCKVVTNKGIESLIFTVQR